MVLSTSAVVDKPITKGEPVEVSPLKIACATVHPRRLCQSCSHVTSTSPAPRPRTPNTSARVRLPRKSPGGARLRQAVTPGSSTAPVQGAPAILGCSAEPAAQLPGREAFPQPCTTPRLPAVKQEGEASDMCVFQSMHMTLMVLTQLTQD